MSQAAVGAADHEEVRMDNLGAKQGQLDRKSGSQIAGNLTPPSEKKSANGEGDTVSSHQAVNQSVNASNGHAVHRCP